MGCFDYARRLRYFLVFFVKSGTYGNTHAPCIQNKKFTENIRKHIDIVKVILSKIMNNDNKGNAQKA